MKKMKKVFMLGMLVGLWVGGGLAFAQQIAPPAPACEDQLRDAQVEIQILTQGRKNAEVNLAHVVTQLDTLRTDLQAARQKSAETAPSVPMTKSAN